MIIEPYRIIPLNDINYLNAIMIIEERSFDKPYSNKAMENAYYLCPWKYCLLSKEELIGYILIFKESRVTYHIVTFAIDPSYRQQGLGTELLKYAIGETRKEGGKEWRLEVEINNHPAIRLYEKIGFERYGMISNYYSNGVHAYLYKLKE